jgi:hypothetical protein
MEDDRQGSASPRSEGTLSLPSDVLSRLKVEVERLTPAQRKELADYLAHLRHQAGAGSPDKLRHLEQVHGSLGRLMLSVYHIPILPLPVLLGRGTDAKALRDATAHLESFWSDCRRLDSAILPHQWTTMVDLCVRLWASRAHQIPNVPLTLRTVCNQAAHTAALFDQAFPGYMASGLVRLSLSKPQI